MIKVNLSIRTILSLVIGLMGALGIILVLISGIIHKNLTLENQQDSIIDLIRLQTNYILTRLETSSRDLGLALQSDKTFRTAYIKNDIVNFQKQLRNQFTQYFVTAGVIKLERLAVFDTRYSLIAEATAPSSRITKGSIICPDQIKNASQRKGADRVQVFSGMCLSSGRPYYMVIVPIDSLRPIGYLQVITDPSHNLIETEIGLGLPLQLSLPNKEIVYQSRKWPTTGSMEDSVITKYAIKTDNGENALILGLASDYSALYSKMRNARYIVIFIAGSITLVAIGLGLLLLRISTFKPLSALNQQLQRVRSNRANLSEQLDIEGNTEIGEFASSFNEMTTELNTLYETLEHMAYTDPLTSLPNRNLFHDQIQNLITQNQKINKPFALFLMDLDRFKEVNDTLGHHAGDKLLQEVSSCFRHVLRISDIPVNFQEDGRLFTGQDMIARLGGDEFAAVLPGVATPEHAAAVARKLLKAIEKPFIIHDNKLVINVSIGIVLYPHHGLDKHTLLRRADVAMYYAKKTKRSFVFYESEQDSHNLHLLNLERDLITAIENNELVLYYQPQINIQSGKVHGAEALVRWQHPEKGMLLPDNFIPLAEESGIIEQLTLWVLKQALDDCKNWQKLGYQFGVSVNFSALNLHDPKIIDTVPKILKKSGLKSNMLTIELTESSVMSDPNHALNVLSELRKMGLRLSVDDFGTGYSSLTYIKLLPVDEIKIDKTFIIEMVKDKNDEAIVRSTTTLAHNMGMQVVAEGVEDAETLSRLATIGCDIAQGFYPSYPLPFDNLITWLAKTKDRKIIPIDKHRGRK